MPTPKSQDYLVWLRETIASLEEAGKANILPDIGVDWQGIIEELYDAGEMRLAIIKQRKCSKRHQV